MKEYTRNVAIVGSALYGGILMIGFLVLLLFDNGAALYKQYTVHTSTFLIFAFLFTPSILFVGATTPWIGAVYDSSAAAIALVVVPGCVLAVLLLVWFCLASNEGLYHGDRNDLDGTIDGLNLNRVDGGNLFYDHVGPRGSVTTNYGAGYVTPSLLSAPFNTSSPSRGMAHTTDVDFMAPPPQTPTPMAARASARGPRTTSPWQVRRVSPSPRPSGWASTSYGVPQEWPSPAAAPAVAASSPPPSAPPPLQLSPEAEWRRQQYIADRLAQAETVLDTDGAVEVDPGVSQVRRRSVRDVAVPPPLPPQVQQQQQQPSSFRTNPNSSVGSLYLNTLPSASRRRTSPSRPAYALPLATRLALDAPPPIPLHEAAARAVAAPVRSPPPPTAQATHAETPHYRDPRVSPTHVSGGGGGNVAPISGRSEQTPRVPPLSASSPAQVVHAWTGVGPQQIYVDVPFASELRD